MILEMDLGLIGIILAVIFFASTIIFAVRSARRKTPVYFYNTKKIIGLGADAPSEIKIFFRDKPVTEVYRTTITFFNRGNEVIRSDDVTEKVTFLFKGVHILDQPNVVATSKKAIKFLVKQVIKDGDDAIELSFLYLDRKDGAVIEVLHTANVEMDCKGNIIGVKKIAQIDEFERPYFLFRVPSPRLFGWITAMSMLAIGFSVGALLVDPGAQMLPLPILLLILILSSIWFIGTVSLIVIPYLMYKPPKWSHIRK